MTQDKPITVTYCTCSHPNLAHMDNGKGPCEGIDGWGSNNWNCTCQEFKDDGKPSVQQYALKEVE